MSSSQYGVSTVTVSIRKKAIASSAVPITGKILYLPVRDGQLTGQHGAAHDADHHRDQQQTGLGRRRALHQLQVQRQRARARRTCRGRSAR